jgi:hypothetical protein
MKRFLEVVSVIALAYVVILVLGIILNVFHHPEQAMFFIWSLVIFPFDLIGAAISKIFDYLAIIVGATISVAAVIAGTFINLRFIGSQFRRLNIRLDRADRGNLFVAFLLFLLPTLLAVTISVRRSKRIHNKVAGRGIYRGVLRRPSFDGV